MSDMASPQLGTPDQAGDSHVDGVILPIDGNDESRDETGESAGEGASEAALALALADDEVEKNPDADVDEGQKKAVEQGPDADGNEGQIIEDAGQRPDARDDDDDNDDGDDDGDGGPDEDGNAEPNSAGGHKDRDSDDGLSELDENQFEDYDPVTANIQDRPVAIDADAAQTLKASKRKRTDGDGAAARKAKSGRREMKRSRREEDDRDDNEEEEDDNDDDDGEDSTGGRTWASRKRGTRTSKAARPPPEKTAPVEAAPEQENEEDLTPEERRKRAIKRALDASAAASKKSTRRKKKDDIDLETAIDEELSDLKVRMEKACEADNASVSQGRPAVHKLKLLPEVSAMLSRNNARDAVLDPETNLLRHVRFFLEPLPNGVLPAYNIQRDLITALTRLPVGKETLISSQLGGLILFYTQSRQPQAGIKRMAQRLVEDWSRPVLNRNIQMRSFDSEAVRQQRTTTQSSQFSIASRPAKAIREAQRERMLAPVNTDARARFAGLPATYTIAPKSTFDGARGSEHLPIGASGAEAFRRIALKNKKR